MQLSLVQGRIKTTRNLNDSEPEIIPITGTEI